MIVGSSCWSASVQQGMGPHTYGAREAYTFDDMPQSIYWALVRTAERTPDAIAIVDDWGRRFTFAALLAHVDELGASLVAQGICAGDHIGLLMNADFEYAVSLFAISRMGGVCIPIPTKYREPEVVSLCDAAELAAIVVGEEFEPWAESLASKVGTLVWAKDVERGYGFSHLSSAAPVAPAGDLADPVIMMFTSGTTSAAKGVLLRNYNVMHAAMVYQRLMATTPADRCLIPIPIYHVTGLIALLIQFVYVGATSYLHRRFNPRRVLTTVRDEKITYLHASPTAFAELVPLRPEFPELPSVRCMLSGSSYEPIGTMRAFHAWMPTASFQVVYGMTETSSPALLFPWDSPTSIYAGATGKPVPGLEAKIVDDDGREVELGACGELLMRGACITEGYFGNVAAGPDEDGWLATGDIAWANAEGMVWVVDRKKDMINRGGEKVWCSALEEVLCELPGVRAACVTGIEDELYGEVPVAALVLEKGASLTEQSVKSQLAGRVAHFKIPVHIIFLHKIPQTRGDKPDRAAVKNLVLAAITNQD